MAVNLFTGATNSNTNTATNWSQGTVPTVTDGHVTTFDATSPNYTVNAALACNNIDWTGYTNTGTHTNNVTVSGNVTLDSTMASRITGSGSLFVNATGTLTSNGGTWINALTFTGTSQTYTLADNWTVSGTVTFAGATAQTINGSTLICNGNLTSTSPSVYVTGTTNISMQGTSTIVGSNGGYALNIDINTAGTISITNTMYWKSGTFSYTAGTLSAGTSTINHFSAGSFVLSLGAQTAYNVSLISTSALGTTLNCSGTLTLSSTILNTYAINCSGNLTMTGASSGSSTITMTGTGTWSGSGQVRNNLTIKSTAIIDIVGNVQFNTGTFIVELGAQVNASNSNLTVANTATTTFDISTIKLNNFYLGGGSTVNTLQLNSPLYITGTAFLGASSQGQTINGSPVYIENGTLTSGGGNQGAVLGTSQIIANGDKFTYLDNSFPTFLTGVIWRLPITINVRGTILMYGRLVISTGGTFTILNGTVDHRDGIVNRTSLLIQANTTLTNIDKCKFKNITVTAGVTITMNKFFTGSPEFKSVIRSNGATNYNITFTDGVPKKAYFVNVKNCTVTQTTTKNQLNIIGRDSNAGFNTGIIFGESGMEAFPLNQYVTENSYPTASGFSQGGMNN